MWRKLKLSNGIKRLLNVNRVSIWYPLLEMEVWTPPSLRAMRPPRPRRFSVLNPSLNLGYCNLGIWDAHRGAHPFAIKGRVTAIKSKRSTHNGNRSEPIQIEARKRVFDKHFPKLMSTIFTRWKMGRRMVDAWYPSANEPFWRTYLH